ncbi:hypothetical protein CWS31_004040 [Colwellia echini]|uniref:Uncharacterized protein n=1 Tax=Colwellia echini TaxID=1982103 RepID=A0ABY3MZR5_9GAMM|nr:hypothetical protein CWS31_004040 [Colwellia echini]
MLDFTEEQNQAPSFILIYILTWCAWHNQLFSHFISAEGDFLTRMSTAFSEMGENQFILVLFFTCIIFLGRLAFNYFSFRSRELLNSAEDTFENIREDQKFAKNSDIANLMDALTKTKQQLVEAKEREKDAIKDKNDTLKKLLSLQNELDEANADIAVLTKSQQLSAK